MFLLLVIVLVVVGLLGMVIFMASRYKRCPSDKLLVVYGKTSGGSAKVYHGGGVFVWPVIQSYAFLDLEPMSINIPLKNALSKQNIRVDVPSTFTVAISTDDTIRKNAAERLLGQSRDSIENLVSEILLGQLRLVIATMDIEEINANRDKFLEAITENLETELKKVGLQLINSNIQDISDESGYIEALGKEASAKAINEAKVSVAEKDRDGDIGQSRANKERAIETAKLRADAEVGEANAKTESEIGKADADARSRSKSAEFNAQAIEGENTAAIDIANTTADRKVAEANANKKAEIAKNVTAAQAQEESYAAEKIAEDARAQRDKATQYADIVVPAQIEKEKVEVDAEAEAEQTRRIAKGNADAVKMEGEAEGAKIRSILEGRAKGFDALVKSAGSPEAAIQLLVVDKLDDLMRIQVDAIKNLKIDSVTVWDTGGNGNGNGTGSSTGDFIKGLLGSLPAYDEIYRNVTGNELPSVLSINDGDKGKEETEEKPEEPLNDGRKSAPGTKKK